MEQGENGAGKPQCCSGQGLGSAGKRPGCPGPELVLLGSHFTVGPGEGGAQPFGCPCPHSQVPAPFQGCPHPLPAVLLCQGRGEPGQDVLVPPNRGTAAPRSPESAEPVVKGP